MTTAARRGFQSTCYLSWRCEMRSASSLRSVITFQSIRDPRAYHPLRGARLVSIDPHLAARSNISDRPHRPMGSFNRPAPFVGATCERGRDRPHSPRRVSIDPPTSRSQGAGRVFVEPISRARSSFNRSASPLEVRDDVADRRDGAQRVISIDLHLLSRCEASAGRASRATSTCFNRRQWLFQSIRRD